MRVTTAKLSNFLLVLLGAFFLAFSAGAQQMPFELLWEKGTVFLTSGDSVSGQITLTLPRDIVSVKQPNGMVSAFATVNVESFEVKEERNSNNYRSDYGPLEFARRYETYLWNHNKDYSNFLTPAFFVVVQPGAYTLLMRETKIQNSVAMNGYALNDRYRNERIVQHFYLAKPDKQILPLRNPKKDLQLIFPNLKDKMVTFAKTEKLDFDDPLELARIIEYCNRSL